MQRDQGVYVLRVVSDAKAKVLEKITLAQDQLTNFGGRLIEELSQIESQIKFILESGEDQLQNSFQILERYSRIKVTGCSLNKLIDKIQQYYVLDTGNVDGNLVDESSSRKEICRVLSELLTAEANVNITRNKEFKESLEIWGSKLISLLRSHVISLNHEEVNASISKISQDKELSPDARYNLLDLQLELKFQILLAEKKIDPSKFIASSTNSFRRLTKEFAIENYERGIRIWNEGELDKVKALILGPLYSPYEGGIYLLDISLDGYPMSRPQSVRFITKVYHPNIALDGKFSLDIYEDNWSPAWTISRSLIGVQSFLCEVNTDYICSLNNEASILLATMPEKFNSIAEQWRIYFAN